MDHAPAATAQGQDDKASSRTNPQSNQSASTTQAAPVPNANAIPQGDLSNLSLPPELPADLHSFMMPHDGSMLGADALMNMPMMMPMAFGGMDGSMDAHGLLNMPHLPQNGISNGKFSPRLYWQPYSMVCSHMGRRDRAV